MSTNPYGGSIDEIDPPRRSVSFSARRATLRLVGLGLFLVIGGVVGLLLSGRTTAPRHPSRPGLVATPGFAVSIKGVNMEPTLEPGDTIAATINFEPDGIARGDIVVFNQPADDTTPGVTNVVGRIVGLPGETISATGRQVYINGRPLRERWLPAVDRTTTSDFGPTPIPTGEYFVMGDNRADSADSRTYGPIPTDVILGVAVGITSPADRARTLTS